MQHSEIGASILIDGPALMSPGLTGQEGTEASNWLCNFKLLLRPQSDWDKEELSACPPSMQNVWEIHEPEEIMYDTTPLPAADA